MKKGLRGGLLAFLILAEMLSCSRHSASPGNDCISRYTPSTTSVISSSQLDSVNNLFSKNHLSTSGLQFLSLSTYTTVSPAYTGLNMQIAARRFINGLLAAGYTEYFTFDSTGVFMGPAIGAFTGAPPDKDTSTRQSLESLRHAFLNNYKKCTIVGGVANSQPYHPTAPYQDSCLFAQLVYVDAATGQTNATANVNLVKAWLVFPATYTPNPWTFAFPEVTVIDATGQGIPIMIAIP